MLRVNTSLELFKENTPHCRLYDCNCFFQGCGQCFLTNILSSLKNQFLDATKNLGADVQDIIFILSQGKSPVQDPQASLATAFIAKEFPGVDCKLNDQFEGMEKKCVFSITNGSIGTTPHIIPVSLTRANNHLVLVIEDFRDILKDAVAKNLVTMRKALHVLTEEDTRSAQEAMLMSGVREATAVLASNEGTNSSGSIKSLAGGWNLVDFYNQLVAEKKSAHEVVWAVVMKHVEDNPAFTVHQLLAALHPEKAALVKEKLRAHLSFNVDDLSNRTIAGTLTVDEQMDLADNLGKMTLFDSLTRTDDPAVVALSDPEATLQCLERWTTEATAGTTTEELVKCIPGEVVARIREEIERKIGAGEDQPQDVGQYRPSVLSVGCAYSTPQSPPLYTHTFKIRPITTVISLMFRTMMKPGKIMCKSQIEQNLSSEATRLRLF